MQNVRWLLALSTLAACTQAPTPSTVVTSPCGAAGQDCCDNNACSAGLLCSSGICAPLCPDSGQACPALSDAGAMDAGLVVDAGASDGGNPGDAGPPPYQVTTVTNAWANLATLSGGGVEIDGAIVVAAHSRVSSSPTCTSNTEIETFYIQDATGGAGVAVFHACTDQGDYPNVGDIVTVQGRLAKFDGSLQIASSTKYNIALHVQITSAGGGDSLALTGAYPPVGAPTAVAAADQAGYSHLLASPHPEQLGTVLHFDGVSVVNEYPPGFSNTSADGGLRIPEGFEITNGVWVDDSNVYQGCIAPLRLDGGNVPLPGGVTGVWDKYQDYYGSGLDGGYSPVVNVLVLQQCTDLQ